MHFVIGIVGLFAFLVLAWLPSSDRGAIKTKIRPIVVMLVAQFILGLLMLRTGIGETIVHGIQRGFDHLLEYAGNGTSFVFGDLTKVGADNPMVGAPFLLSVLMPIVFVSMLIGILQYIKVLPFIIKYLGLALSKINGFGKLESFNAVASLLLGQSEVFISVKNLLPTLPRHRMYTLAASAMSTVSASILGAYMQLIDARYVITAIVLNLFGAFIVVSLINPYTVTKTEDDESLREVHATDEFAEGQGHRQSFFEMLGEYILAGFKVAFTVAAMLIGFIALIALLNGVFAGIFHGTTFQDVLGHIFAPLAFITGVPWDQAVEAGKFMATKLVTNEVVAMTQLKGSGGDLSVRTTAIVSTFLVSFANFSSIGIIAGAVQSLNKKQGANVAQLGLRLLYGATLVSFVSATIVGLIV